MGALKRPPVRVNDVGERRLVGEPALLHRRDPVLPVRDPLQVHADRALWTEIAGDVQFRLIELEFRSAPVEVAGVARGGEPAKLQGVLGVRRPRRERDEETDHPELAIHQKVSW